MEGSSGVLYPGEIEKIREAERRAGGISIEDATWKRLTDLAAELGVDSNIG
jgi:LDH2 family malate/lactate/ureidoglycolate dehydrogenase